MGAIRPFGPFAERKDSMGAIAPDVIRPFGPSAGFFHFLLFSKGFEQDFYVKQQKARVYCLFDKNA